MDSPGEELDTEIIAFHVGKSDEDETMRTKITMAFIATLIGFTGCKPPESEYGRYNKEANEVMLEYCTNNIVGWNHFLSIDLRHFITDSNNTILDGDINDPHNWEGKIVAEYVNHVGGIDRTNLTFRFTLDTNEFRTPKICVALDYHCLAVQEAAKQQAEFDAWKKNLNLDNQ